MRLVLLDRDGVLNEDRDDFVKSPSEFVMIPGSAEAVARLNGAGIKVAVVSNQSGVARGLFDNAMLERLTDKLREELRRAGAHLDLVLYCTDHPDMPSERRKPAPGMLREALSHFRIAPDRSCMIGDKLADLEAAHRASCRRILVRTGKGPKTQGAGLPSQILPVSVYDSLSHAVDALLRPPAP